ncbi:MAG: alternative ribosome rescue aminoacyl-tRNA hydrolase ArfB [Desulforhopalus sp.]
MALFITDTITLDDREVELLPIRAQGAGGQNVNKVSSAIHLRFDIRKSSLPELYKKQLLARRDTRLTDDGVLIIKAQQYRTQERNREDALQRLTQLIRLAGQKTKRRKATRPTVSARRKRVDSKTKRGRTKVLRKKITEY